jgi:hypothetical protein
MNSPIGVVINRADEISNNSSMRLEYDDDFNNID